MHIRRNLEMQIGIALRPAAGLHGADIDRKRTIARRSELLALFVVDHDQSHDLRGA